MLKHPVPKELLEGIGDVIVSFALLELEMQSLLGSLLHDNQRIGRILASHLSFARLRAATLSTYCELHGEDRGFEELRAIMRDADTAEKERNRIVHSIWGAGSRPGVVMRLKVTAVEKRGFHVQGEEYDRPRLEGYVVGLRELTQRIMHAHVSMIENGQIVVEKIETSN